MPQSLATRLLEHMVTPTFVIDLNSEVIVWNKACEQLTGIKREEILGSTEFWRAFYLKKRETLAEIVLKGKDNILDQLYENHQVTRGEVKNTIHAENWVSLPALGLRKYIAIDAGPVFNENGQLEAVVESIRDLTELKNIQDSLSALATSDSLTGLGNRRLFDGQLHNYWYNARRQRESFSILLIDIDYFKQFNDHYGHPAGDHLLSRLGLILSTTVLRNSDQCFRYGGEEFAILLPGTDKSGAMDVAKRLRDRIYDQNIDHAGSLPYKRVTASIGVATLCPGPADEPAQLLASADRALYASKASGRNFVTHSDDLEGSGSN